jgi:type II secretory pathway pseudopilin PulG
MKRSGFTQVEMVIYVALTAVVFALVGSLFKLAKNTSQNADANYFLSADAETCVAWLRRDLQQCSLQTIQNYPAASTSNSQPPGISMCSALETNNAARIYANDQGNPYWNNHVYYTLQPLKGNTGKLVRWINPTATNSTDAASLAPLLPNQIVQKGSRVVHSRVLMPNQKLWGVDNKNGTIDNHGGFALRFVRQDANGVETLSDESPAVVSAKKGSQEFRNNTKLVELELKFYTDNNAGKPSFYSLRFRVCPTYD